MTAAVRDLYMEQGATFFDGFNWCHESDPPTNPPTAGEPYDLLDPPASALMQIRVAQGSPVLIDASSDGTNPMISFSTGGRVDIVIPAEDTDALIVKKAKYDLEITLGTPLPNGEPDVRRITQGSITINLNITQMP